MMSSRFGSSDSYASRLSLSLLLVILLLSATTTAQTLQTQNASEKWSDYCEERSQPGLTTSAPLCEVPGLTDFYGLGVRLGVYFAWCSSWVANNFVASEMAGALDTNAIFLLSLTTTVVVQTSLDRIFVIDSLVLIQLAFGCVFGVMSLWGYRTRYYKQRHPDSDEGEVHFGGWGTHCRLILSTIVSFYALWFWTWSVAHPEPKCFLREDCGGLKTFFFSSQALYGWTRYPHALVAAACCVYYGTATIVAGIALATHVFRWFTGRTVEWIPQFLEAGEDRLVTIPYVVLATFNLLWMVFIVLCVEFTLNYNHVAGVLAGDGTASPGQLLPLFVGLFSFIRTLYILYRERFILAKDEASGEQNETNESRSTRPSSLWQLLIGVVTAWLPWLNCFDWWRRYGRDVVSSSQRFRVVNQHEDYDTTKLRVLQLDGAERQ